ncbi:MAG: MASE1 domain-containing protein [Candidatus Sericytochromatia bacterium]|nr:MASE1 domain-containing protein [Candidatus Sericytochromatia bacterium]
MGGISVGTGRLGQVAMVAAGYVLLGWLGNQMALQPSYVAVLWPAAGLSLAAVLAFGAGVWPGIWLGAALQALQSFVPSLGWPGALLVAASLGTGSALHAVVGGWLLRRRGFRAEFDRAEDVFSLLVLGGLLACVISATLGVAAFLAVGLDLVGEAPEGWLVWWLGDTLGVVLVAPICLLAPRLAEADPISHLERVALLAALGLVAGANFIGWLPVPLLFVPLLLWAALRLAPARAVLAVVSVSGLVVVATRLGLGPFNEPSRLERARSLQRFLGTVSVPVLALVAALAARRRVEAELRSSSLLLQAVIENIPDVLFLKSHPDMRYVLVNRAYERQLGTPREAVVGLVDAQLFPAELAAYFAEQDRGVLASGQLLDVPAEPVETRHGPIWFHTKKVPVHDGPGGPRYLLGIAEDITALRAARAEIESLNRQLAQRVEALEAAYAELETFTYTVSHDLRAPVRAIDGFAQALRDGYADQLDERGRRWLNHVGAGAQRLGLLIDDSLQLARVSRRELTITDVDFSALARAIAGELATAEPGRRVVWDIQPGLVVRGDEGLLRILLTNLLGNAWKFSRQCDPAHITLRCLEAGGDRVFEVADDGAGFDMAYADKLFKPFSRLHGDEEFEGTGVGLATVARVVQRHGGTITAEGRVNGGATFRFTLDGHGGGVS